MELLQSLLQAAGCGAGGGEAGEGPAAEWSAAGGVNMSSNKLTIRYASRDRSPTNELYLVGWPAHVGVDELKGTFASLGFTVVKANLLPDKKGQGLCAGFVHMSSEAEATEAIRQMSGREIQWDAFSAQQPWRSGGALPGAPPAPLGRGGGALPSGAAPLGGPGGGGGAGRGPPAAQGAGSFSGTLTVRYAARDGTPSNELFVLGWPAHLDGEMFGQMFESLGFKVWKSNLLPDTKGTGRCGGFAHLGSQEEAARAIAALHGQSITVDPAPAPGPGAPGGGLAPATASSIQELALQALTAIQRAQSGGALGGRGAPRPRGGASSFTLAVKYAARDGTPSNELYVMGWPAHLDKGMFCEVFTQLGFTVVKANLLPDTKGFGFCCAFAHLASQEEAAAAIKRLDGQDVSVEGAGGGVQDWSPAPRVNHTGALRGGVARSSNKLTVRYASRDQSPTHELYLMGWPAHVDVAELDALFASQGFCVVKSSLLPDRKGLGLCGGFVHLATAQEAADAIRQLHGHEIQWDASAPADQAQWLQPKRRRLEPPAGDQEAG